MSKTVLVSGITNTLAFLLGIVPFSAYQNQTRRAGFSWHSPARTTSLPSALQRYLVYCIIVIGCTHDWWKGRWTVLTVLDVCWREKIELVTDLRGSRHGAAILATEAAATKYNTSFYGLHKTI